MERNGAADATTESSDVQARNYRVRRATIEHISNRGNPNADSPASGCPCGHLFHLSQKPWNRASEPDTLSGMHKIIGMLARSRAALHTEILALRQHGSRPETRKGCPAIASEADRVWWVILSCLWPELAERPDHASCPRPSSVGTARGSDFSATWKLAAGKASFDQPVLRDIRYMVRRDVAAEHSVGRHLGLPLPTQTTLGLSISQAAVSKYMVRYLSQPTQSWRTFLANHADAWRRSTSSWSPRHKIPPPEIGFIVLHRERLHIVQIGVTANLRRWRGSHS